MTPRIDVVGLGPGDASLVTPATREIIDGASHRYLRTLRHPSAETVTAAVSFDEEYERADTFADVYREIARRLVEAATREGSIVYAVPGSPLVLERTVEHLLAQSGVRVIVHPAMSFLDVAWARLGVDPVDSGVTLIDGHRFAEMASGITGPALVAHCHNQRVLSDIKLSTDVAPSRPVTVLQRLGGDDERVFEVDWWDLDRNVDADHLTSLYIPEPAPSAARALGRLSDVVHTLRRECPWDREQTHGSLRRHLVEETHEVLEAIDRFVDAEAAADTGAVDRADEHLREELGDLLFQAFIHAVIADEGGRFSVADIADGIHDKLVSRHPHVFGDAETVDADALVVQWEAAKVAEKGRASVFDGIPAGIPGVALLGKVQRKAATLGVDVSASAGGLRAELDRIDDESAIDEAQVSRLVSLLVAVANQAGVDVEDAARNAARRLRDRATAVERSGADGSEVGAFEG